MESTYQKNQNFPTIVKEYHFNIPSKMKKILLLILFGFFFQCSKTIACNANFTHTYACAGDTVFFEALDQFAVYTWDFGDGSPTEVAVNPSYHIFVNPGT